MIDFVLSHTLRLFHPFLPFITEELWHGMGYATDMPENQGGKTIMFAPWPKPLDDDFKGHYGLDDCYLKIADAKYELVSQGRNLRREANIPAAKKIRYVLKPVNYLPPHDIEVIRLLLNAEAVEVNEDYQPAERHADGADGTGRIISAARRFAQRGRTGRRESARSPRNWKKSKRKFPRSSRNWPTRTSRKKFRRRFCRNISSASPSGRPSAPP